MDIVDKGTCKGLMLQKGMQRIGGDGGRRGAVKTSKGSSQKKMKKICNFHCQSGLVTEPVSMKTGASGKIEGLTMVATIYILHLPQLMRLMILALHSLFYVSDFGTDKLVFILL